MNRKELHAYALVHMDTPGVPQVLLSIKEAELQLTQAVTVLDRLVCAARAHADTTTYESMDNISAYAVRYEHSAAKLNTLFVTLASLLEAAGHKVDY